MRQRLFICSAALLATLLGLLASSGSARAQYQAPAPIPPFVGETHYRIAGFEKRQEYILSDAEWRASLGKAGARQLLASRVLIILGGLTAFSGGIALLATLGAVADNSNYGQKVIAGLGAGPAYESYVYGFSALFATGGALVVTGLVLRLPLPSRVRPLLLPRLEVAPSGRF